MPKCKPWAPNVHNARPKFLAQFLMWGQARLTEKVAKPGGGAHKTTICSADGLLKLQMAIWKLKIAIWKPKNAFWKLKLVTYKFKFMFLKQKKIWKLKLAI